MIQSCWLSPSGVNVLRHTTEEPFDPNPGAKGGRTPGSSSPTRFPPPMPSLLRLAFALALLAAVWAAPASAQCSPAVQKLIADRELEAARTQMTAAIAKASKDH